jgi:hypothetical protein
MAIPYAAGVATALTTEEDRERTKEAQAAGMVEVAVVKAVCPCGREVPGAAVQNAEGRVVKHRYVCFCENAWNVILATGETVPVDKPEYGRKPRANTGTLAGESLPASEVQPEAERFAVVELAQGPAPVGHEGHKGYWTKAGTWYCMTCAGRRVAAQGRAFQAEARKRATGSSDRVWSGQADEERRGEQDTIVVLEGLVAEYRERIEGYVALVRAEGVKLGAIETTLALLRERRSA